MSAPLAAEKVAWRAAFDKLDIAEIGPGAPMETRDRVAAATLHLSVAVQAGTAGRYRSPVPLDYGDPMRRRLQLRAVRVFSASGREMMERRHDDDIAIGAEFRDLAGR
ncbi:hypothetical protein GYN07_24770 [Rhizobium leguminosarum bv. viciae 248]|uniref:hypothetical protein n=1 Tax=Rhizobium leguminosarum TaxID=384 RepID=UPI0005193989|nr:hypothetical protein [Rhizobium leguminosarum]MCA2406004.1 hypothetical protein [Rhizobium leguminosarum]NKM63426.1 hypothetical protein [Rhizobium leguminosarum bv. viciae]QHW27359.1 hypothetical protein GYN07_24770 [Rhizobium leguminosarum bv. viciae 248]